MSLFDAATAFIIDEIEGPHANDPRDSGGDTAWGLARASHPTETPWPPSRERAVEIYRSDYWNAVSGDLLPPRLAVAVYDSAINEGTGTAIEILQTTLGVAVDGVLGPRTLAAALARAPRPLARDFLTHRILAYFNLKQFNVFGHSWVYRCFQISGFTESLP